MRWRVEIITQPDLRTHTWVIVADTREQFKDALNRLGATEGIHYSNVAEVRFVRL